VVGRTRGINGGVLGAVVGLGPGGVGRGGVPLGADPEPLGAVVVTVTTDVDVDAVCFVLCCLPPPPPGKRRSAPTTTIATTPAPITVLQPQQFVYPKNPDFCGSPGTSVPSGMTRVYCR
jgi:hypothetical protein